MGNDSVDGEKKDDKSSAESASKEDLLLQHYIDILQENDPAEQRYALEKIREAILHEEGSTKFFYTHYGTLKAYSEKMQDSDLKKLLADILSVLASTVPTGGERPTAGSEADGPSLVLIQHVDETSCRVLHMGPIPINLGYLSHDALYNIWLEAEDYVEALRAALFLDNMQDVAFKLDKDMVDDDNRQQLQDIINNVELSKRYLAFFRDANPNKDIHEYLKEKFMSYETLLEKMEFCRIIAKHNLSGDFDHDHWTFKLDEEMVEHDHERKQLQNIINNDKKNESDFNIREGLRLLWDVDSGLTSLVNYFHSNDSNVAAGTLLGAGIVNCDIKNVDDCALALLSPYIDDGKPTIQIGAIMGLGIAYANTRHELM